MVDTCTRAHNFIVVSGKLLVPLPSKWTFRRRLNIPSCGPLGSKIIRAYTYRDWIIPFPTGYVLGGLESVNIDMELVNVTGVNMGSNKI